MSEENKYQPTTGDKRFSREVRRKADRKLRARRRGEPPVWTGLGLFGMIGWSVAVPTLLGAALGLWLDRHYPAQHSWTLTLLLAGLVLGCINAWHWVAREEKAMRKENDE